MVTSRGKRDIRRHTIGRSVVFRVNQRTSFFHLTIGINSKCSMPIANIFLTIGPRLLVQIDKRHLFLQVGATVSAVSLVIVATVPAPKATTESAADRRVLPTQADMEGQ